MSIDRCMKCWELVDVDGHPESYREDEDFDCICDKCYNESDREETQNEPKG